MLNKRALSPLVATILLVVFALIIGTATMSLSKNYVNDNTDDKELLSSSMLIISIDEIDNPLKDLQIKYITNKLTLEEYLNEEEVILREGDLGNS
ncbi:MAG: hypothetical protein KAK00_01435 [Nanoarchaeota archaeon]|nr:hypothetical protein [Nanoarchaeota archaeon]